MATKYENKNSPRFPHSSRAINLLIHRLSHQKLNAILTFIKVIRHQLQQYNRSPPQSDYVRNSQDFVATPWDHNNPVYPVNSSFTQPFEWQTKTTLLVTIFPRGCTEFAEFPTFREIPEYSRFVATQSYLASPSVWCAEQRQCLKSPSVSMDFGTRYRYYLLLPITCYVPSVLWRCWLGGRKGIRPVKNWVVGC